MAFDKISNYANDDEDIENVQLTLDKAFKGKGSISLTEMATTTTPEIAQGSWMDVNGALYDTDSDTSISTTDPVTTATVVDGDVYVVLISSAGVVTASFTATVPTWSDTKQGWYGTGGQAGYRYIAFMVKAGSSYTEKRILIGGSNDLNGRLFDPDEV